jgi:hypothetical protein
LHRVQRVAGVLRDQQGEGHHHGMNTSQLQCCIDCDPLLAKHVIGVFAADRLPRSLTRYPCGFIANTDNYSQPGTHWCVFYFTAPGVVEFFDTYGQRPGSYNRHFVDYISRFTKVTFNERQLQSDVSNVCGLYCLFYLLHRLRGKSFRAIVNIFASNTYENDAFVYQFMMSSFPHCVSENCVHNQSCKPLGKIHI